MRAERIRREAPKILQNEGQAYFNRSYQSQTWEGKAWPEVQRRIPGTKAYKYPKGKYLSRRTNPILIGKTRRLKNAVNRASAAGSANVNKIIWRVAGSEGAYGHFHNEGIGQKPRPFMKASKGLGRVLRKKFATLYRRLK